MLERLQFYRELGVGPLYRREVSRPTTPDPGAELIDGLAAIADELEAEAETISEESYLPSANTGASAKAERRPAELEDRSARLRLILDDIGPNCQRCKLAKQGRKQIVFGTGAPNAELMFIGEGPGADEDAQGLPFVGRAGQLLNNMIAAMGLKREQVYIANIVKCRPPGNRTPERDECETCSPFLMRQISVIQPKVIVALGATAAKHLLGLNDSMASLRGRFYDFSPPGTLTGGEPLECKLVVTYHPAFLLRDPRQKKEAWKDLQMVMRHLGLSAPKREANPENP
ncbi:MAG: uracil-DNA glycosylase [Acidobacteriota bacterium]|nr:uracil-DNA glycosylase [Acidobacteriota bacterium]